MPSLQASGAVDTLLVAVDFAVGPLVIALIVTKRHGVGEWSWLEKLCVAGSLLGGLMWWAFDSPRACFAIVFTIDCLGAIPTICKAVVKPREESVKPWSIFTVGSALNMVAADSEKFWEIMYALGILAIDILVLAPLLVPRNRK